MQKLKKLLAVLVCAAMALAAAPCLTVSAETRGPYGLYYEKYDDHVEITGYTGSATELNIPAEIDGLPVTEIRDRVFWLCSSLTSVTIPEGVTEIGNSAFYGCSELTGVNIPDGVTSIYESTFFDCSSLKSMALPDSVTFIGDDAFQGCTNLLRVSIPDKVTSIGIGAFAECESLESISIPDSVTEIGRSAFYACLSLESVDISNSVTEIAEYTFYGCSSLTSVTIPDSVTEIGENAFYGCSSLISVDLSTGMTSIGSFAFWGCESLESLTIPADVKNFGEYIFGACSGLSSVTILDGVTNIGKGTFSYCKNLTSVDISGSVTSIGDYAFDHCSNLESISIPNSVTYIGGDAFAYCPRITSIDIPDSVTSIGGSAFNGCSSLTEINVGAGNKNYKSQDGVLFVGTSALVRYPEGKTQPSYDIPEGVTSIYSYAFFGCSNLTKATIPVSVTEIGYLAFSGCSSLSRITIPASATKIDESAFADCSSLTEISVDADNETYESQDGVLFNKKTSVLIQYPAGNAKTNYQVPEGIWRISQYAFDGCSRLTSITFPSSVSTIYPFDGCSSLTEINVDAGNENYTSQDGVLFDLFDEETPILLQYPIGNPRTSYRIPDFVADIDVYAFRGCTNLANITIPSSMSMTRDNKEAIQGCSSLAEINVDTDNKKYISQDGVLFDSDMRELVLYPAGNTRTSYEIPKDVRTISLWAFKDCSNLTSVTIPDSVRYIAIDAFEGCLSLTDVYYGGDEAVWNRIGGMDAIPDGVKIHCSDSAPEIFVPEVSQSGGEITVTVEGSDVPASAAIIAVGCGAKGELIDAAAVTNGEASLTGEGVTRVKVFCWESLESLRPLCPAVERDL